MVSCLHAKRALARVEGLMADSLEVRDALLAIQKRLLNPTAATLPPEPAHVSCEHRPLVLQGVPERA